MYVWWWKEDFSVIIDWTQVIFHCQPHSGMIKITFLMRMMLHKDTIEMELGLSSSVQSTIYSIHHQKCWQPLSLFWSLLLITFRPPQPTFGIWRYAEDPCLPTLPLRATSAPDLKDWDTYGRLWKVFYMMELFIIFLWKVCPFFSCWWGKLPG